MVHYKEDAMLRRTLIQFLVGTAMGLGSGTALAGEDFDIIEGIHYKPVPKPHATQQKTVTEIFYYGCPHCYHLEPSLDNWLKTKPADVTFNRVPAVLNNPNWIFMARVFYTAKELGILDQFHKAYFKAIQEEHKYIFTPEALAEFVAPMGVTKADYIAMFKSFKVDQEVQKARRLTEDYGVDGVPAIVVNGKYRTDVPMATSKPKLWQVVNYLLNQ